MSDSPYQSPVDPTKNVLDDYGHNDLLAYFEPLYQRRIWAKIIGVVFILGGGLYTITIIGALVGVPLILVGYNLFQAADHLQHGFQGQVGRLQEASRRLSIALLIGGILTLICLIFMILYFLLIFFLIGVGATVN